MGKSFLEVQSLQRALDILESIGSSASPVSLKTLAIMTGLPKTTVYRLLGNLEQRGYVRCHSDGSYQLGIKFMLLSQRADQSFSLKHLARPFLLQLRDRSRETVHLGILDKTKIVYVDTVDSMQSVRMVAQLGSSNPVHCTSLGKALLIAKSDAEILDILATEGMERRTDYTITTQAVFLAEMAKVRTLGYALDDRESALECRCVGAPIFNQAGAAVAAISVSGPASRFSREIIEQTVVPMLLDVTQQLSRSFLEV